MRLEFATAGRIVFGPGTVAELPAIVRACGTRVLVVTGRDPNRAAAPLDALRAAGLACASWSVHGEPTIAAVREGLRHLHETHAGVVVAIGGGSVIDAGKAVAALATNDADPLTYLEVVGEGRPLANPPLPFIAVPTTAGTGAEVTRNAVLGVPERGVKASLRSPLMLPRAAVVDPALTYDLPRALTASTGLDALTQLIEPYVSVRANALVDAICRDGIPRAAAALPLAVRDGRDFTAREAMSYASLLGGLALANAGLGAVHGFAAAIGGRFAAPHGAVCAALLPHVCDANIRALDARAPAHPARRRYDEIARLVTGEAGASASDGVRWLRTLVADLAIPPLSAYGVDPPDVDDIVEAAARASSMKANPIVLTPGELAGVISAASGR